MSEQRNGQYLVVVGFDGSEGGTRALAWAAGEVQVHDARLRVVRAWTPGEFGTDQEQAEIMQKRLDENVATVLGTQGSVAVETVVEQGHAAKVLLHQAANADMLVVGSRGHGGFAGLLLGSVSQHVATHSGAPVVVIVRP
jgi:nucleotide-binding universal stress UspA family protein